MYYYADAVIYISLCLNKPPTHYVKPLRIITEEASSVIVLNVLQIMSIGIMLILNV